jgi:conjugal transfer pilus assembly protein TraU
MKNIFSTIFFIKPKSVLMMIILVSFNLFNLRNTYAKECRGEFVNPITDINWACLFPITIGDIEIISADRDLKDTKNPSSPVCLCPKEALGGVPLPGIVGGYWEPARLVDVTAQPYCFVNMGGTTIDMGGVKERHQGGRPTSSSSQISGWYSHYYIYPIIAILEILTDFICLQETQYDFLWLTELDPTGLDDELSSIMSPESFLFNNVIAQSACAVDCIASTISNKALDPLFWCAGCQGSMYPMNGNVNAHIGGVQASVNVVEKMTYKMHRQLMARESASSNVEKICEKRLSPVIKKSHYRYQMVNPDPDLCYPFGKSTTVFETNKEIPVVAEDFGYLLWRKKNCCIF